MPNSRELIDAVLIDAQTTSKGNPRDSYYVKAMIGDVAFNIWLTPTDKKGYPIIRAIFSLEGKADLYREPVVISDANGEHETGNYRYFIYREVDGIPYECPVNLKKGSDTSLIKTLIAQNQKKARQSSLASDQVDEPETVASIKKQTTK